MVFPVYCTDILLPKDFMKRKLNDGYECMIIGGNAFRQLEILINYEEKMSKKIAKNSRKNREKIATRHVTLQFDEKLKIFCRFLFEFIILVILKKSTIYITTTSCIMRYMAEDLNRSGLGAKLKRSE